MIMQPIPEMVLAVKEGDTFACIDVMCIEKVTLLPKITHSPEVKTGLVGQVVYKNLSLPVYDLSALSNSIRQAPYTTENLVLIVTSRNGYYAFLVDQVIDIFKSKEAEMIDDIKANTTKIYYAYMTLRGSIYNLIDADKVMQS